MDKLIELLPLPSVLLNWPHPTNHVAIRDYARACVAHATTAKDAEIEALRAEVKLLTHKIITCGVAADHPDQNLTRTGAYASEWNSQQAERVRALRARAERLAEALMKIAEYEGSPRTPVYNSLKKSAIARAAISAAQENSDA